MSAPRPRRPRAPRHRLPLPPRRSPRPTIPPARGATVGEALGLTPRNPTWSQQLGMLLCSLALLLTLLAYAWTGGRGDGLALGLLAAGALLLTVGVGAVTCQGQVRAARRLQAGEGWAQWPYPPPVWTRFARAQARQAGQQVCRAAVLAGLGATACSGGLRAAGLPPALSLALGIGIGASYLVVGSPLLVWGWWLGVARRVAAPAVVCFGPQGVLLAGRYLLLAGMNDTLLGVGLVPGSPPSLRFVVRPFQWGWRQPPEELRVPVPPGRVGEAADLVERYRRVHGLRADDAPKHVRIPRV